MTVSINFRCQVYRPFKCTQHSLQKWHQTGRGSGQTLFMLLMPTKCPLLCPEKQNSSETFLASIFVVHPTNNYVYSIFYLRIAIKSGLVKSQNHLKLAM